MLKTLFHLLLAGVLGTAVIHAETAQRWTPEKAKAWHEKSGWFVGCNFIPSTAINQLEMWQADTFDPATIDRELALAESLGFTSVRVFLHDLPWQQDSKGFSERIDKFLGLADRGGVVRVGPTHYNTLEEVDTAVDLIAKYVTQHR